MLPLFITVLLTSFGVFRTVGHSATLEALHSFDAGPALPYSSLLHHGDGNFYGSSGYGGKFDQGAIYRVTPANDISVVISFSGRGGSAPGRRPGELIQDEAGNIYGVAHSGSAAVNSEYGTVFKITPQGAYTLLREFGDSGGSATLGGNPIGPLARDAAGNLYGVTQTGGTASKGIIFKITADGQFTVLVNFTGTSGQARGASPYGGLISDGADGFLGATHAGGANDFGVVFRVLPDGTYTVLGEFTGSSGALPGSDPRYALTPDGAGNFYGVTAGFLHPGAVFRVNANGAVTSLASMPTSVGQYPSGSLVREDSGNFLGVLSLGPRDPIIGAHYHGAIFRVTPAGVVSLVVDPGTSPSAPLVGNQPLALTPDGNGGYIGAMQVGGNTNFGTLFHISSAGEFVHVTAMPGATPSDPHGTLVADAAGNLYGVTRHGGPVGEGTVFKLTPGGSYTTLAAFTGLSGPAKGSIPFPELAIDATGNLFGTTIAGGAANSGTVFKIAPDGAFTTLVEFTGPDVGRNGEAPQGVVLDAAENIFGAARRYSPETDYDEAVVFKITPAGTFSIVGSTGAAFSHYPAGRVAVDDLGNVFGSTRPDDDDPAFLYRMAPDGTVTGISEPRDTSVPYGFVRAPDGAFYGSATTAFYNVSRSRVAKVAAAGSYSEFGLLDEAAHGSYPAGEVLVDETGNVFGTTSTGGPHGRGAIFRVSPRGVVTALYAFENDLIAPLYFARGVMRHPDGAFYGAGQRGGPGGGGFIYRVRSGPTPATLEATGVSGGNATLRAKVNAHGEPTLVVFEYGRTPGLGSETAPVNIGAGPSFLDVDAPLTGLTAGITYFYRPRATSASGAQFGDLLNTSAAYAPFDLWKISHFGNPSRADLDDPDDDGISLLLEYALTLSPTVPEVAGLPKIGISPSQRLTLTFQRDSSRTDVTLIVESAATLDGPWFPVASSFNGQPFPGESAVPGVHTVSVWDHFPIFAAESRFMRLRVTR